jgi:hypothetical protein
MSAKKVPPVHVIQAGEAGAGVGAGVETVGGNEVIWPRVRVEIGRDWTLTARIAVEAGTRVGVGAGMITNREDMSAKKVRAVENVRCEAENGSTAGMNEGPR